MNKTRFLFIVLLLIQVANTTATLFWQENFDYSIGQLTTVSGGSWVNFSGTTNYIQVGSGNLSYSGYVSSGIGNMIGITNTGEDVYQLITTQTPPASGYAALLVNVANTTGLYTNSSTTGDYFASFLTSSSNTTLFGRISIRTGSIANTFNIGLRATSSNAASVWSTTDLNLGTTYLLVLKYKIITGNTNDTAYLWINPTIGGTEPTPDLIQASALTTDPGDIGKFAIRQGSNTPNASIDGIRTGTTWADVCPPTSTPYIVVNPTSLDFGTLLLNDTLQMTYQVSGFNLAAGITVTAPSSEFKVSLTSGSGYASSVVVPLDGSSDSIAPRNVYVIFTPTSEGSKSGNITNTSTSATTQNVTVSGYGTKIKMLSSLSSFGGVEVGQISAEQFYTYKCSGLTPGQNFTVTAPTNYQVSWTSGSGFGSSISQTVPTGGRIPLDTVFARFVPASIGTKYDSISHSSTGATTRYQSVYGRGVASEPTVQASAITFNRVNVDTMTVNWTRGNGAGCMVVARCENPVANTPFDGYFYTAADSFGQGSSLGSGHFVVYKGTGTSVKVKKLYGITTYHFAVFEYNGTDSCENYLTSSYPQNSQLTNSASGKISLTTLGTAYSQDFNTLDTVPKPNILPQGWNFREEGSAANYTYAENNGILNTGNVYSYGMTDSTDRAFGGLQTSSLVPTLSAVFTNNTGSTLEAVDLGYWGELWRLGLQRYDSLKFEISTIPGTWVAYPALDFVTPETTGAYGPRNGNNWLYRNYRWASISGLNIPNGADFRVRWLDANAVSYDDGLAIDDLKLITFNGRTLPRIIYTSPYDTAVNVAVNASIKIGFSDTMNTSSFTYVCSPDPGGWSVSWNSPRNDTVTLTHSNFTYWTNYTFTVTQARDLEGYNLVSGPCKNPFTFRTAVDPAAPPMYITLLRVNSGTSQQGDAIVIRSPTGKRILIDGGDAGSETIVTNFIKDSIDIGTNTKYLDYTFLSHYHSDHGGALDRVIFRMDSLRVGAYDRGDKDASGSTYTDYLDSLAAKGWSSKRKTATVGQNFDIGYGASIQVICVNGKTLSGDSIVPGATDENEHSLGLLINYANKFKMVTCGDISKTQENILATDLGGRISVLKANHHGSNGSSGLKWVNNLNPMITLITVGDGNSYGHVHIEARDSLLADPKGSKATGDSNRLYRMELGSGAACVAGRDTAMYENIHIEVTPNAATVFRVMNDGRTFPALAVELTGFTAMQTSGETIELRWRTESETDCYKWEISRSQDPNGSYVLIGSVMGRGTTTTTHEYVFNDRPETREAEYFYKLTEVETSGQRTEYGPLSVRYSSKGTFSFSLGPSIPNPFSQGRLNIGFSLEEKGLTSLKIYNIMGQEVRTLADGEMDPGAYKVFWDGKDNGGRKVSSGVYYYRLTTLNQSACRKMVIIR